MEAFRNFRKAIHTIVDRLWEEKELRVNQVVLVTDSTEKDLLDGAEALGWHYINHPELGTSEQFGDWAPAILDSAILSRGIGFVGAFFPCPLLSFTLLTNQRIGSISSTFSYIAKRRVESWQDGLTIMI
jgi:hypothetical protein